MAEPIAVGQKAPRVKGINEEGKKINFGDYYKKGPVLVYFYPKADTPGCTIQACNLRDAYTELSQAGITVLGVSMDTLFLPQSRHAGLHHPGLQPA